MFVFIERLEAMGRSGGGVALVVALVLAIVAIGTGWYSFDPEFADATWGPGGLRGLAFFLGVMSVVFALVGARNLTMKQYPSPAELFPSMTREAFIDGLQQRDEVICCCAKCLIQVPAQFSTGACPRCASTLEYFEIVTDEDMDLVIASVS